MEYSEFLSTKRHKIQAIGKTINKIEINPLLFPFQADVVKWACAKGRAGIFLDTGLGKTFIQVEWARLMGQKTLIIAPLSVARQTVKEASKLGVSVVYVRSDNEITGDGSIFCTNYEMIDSFDLSRFGAVVLDESSILKSLSGKTRSKLIDACQNIRFRLACTATPAPNDHIELGNHAEFLGVCTHAEMLATFFINANREHTRFDDDGNSYRIKGHNNGGQEWRLKHHAEEPFFQWLSSWSVAITKPSDLGYDDNGFLLPSLNITPHFIHVDYVPDNSLFFTHLKGIQDRVKIRRHTMEMRLNLLRKVIGYDSSQWIIWCGLDAESAAVSGIIGADCIEVKGSDSPEHKSAAFEAFQDGKIRVLVTKPRIGGFGMNFQNAHNMVFFGLSDSWESWYQCIRREWRYGQASPVNVHVVLSDLETKIYHNIQRKDAMATRLRQGLIDQVRKYELEELSMMNPEEVKIETRTESGKTWTAINGDSCEVLPMIPESSVDLSVYSPPFMDLYTYTNSEHDLGNCRGAAEFFDHYRFIISELLRITKPGRLTCVHVSDIPAMASRDGYIGVKDFPGDCIRAYSDAGWVFHGRAFIQKNPQAQAIRTKSKALLFVQLRKDSSDSRPALVDQVLIFSKPGNNAIPITPVENGEMDNETWIEWANGIWLGVHESDTLKYSDARAEDDEKHICPLQLGTIERCIKLYSNPGETVLTPFGGIGSEAYQAVRFNRRAILIELKPSYFDIAVRNLRAIEVETSTPDLFDDKEATQ